MATLTLAILGRNVGNHEFTRHLDDADAGRILAAYGAQMQPVREPAPGGNEITRPPTPQEIVDHIAEGFLRGVLDNVHRHEQMIEAERAAAAVPRIEVRA